MAEKRERVYTNSADRVGRVRASEVVNMLIELSPDETELLRELLDRANADLREEVYKTEAAHWKQALKARAQILETLRVKLQRT